MVRNVVAVEAMKSLGVGAAIVGKPRQHRADGAVVLHGGHIVVGLISSYFAFIVEGDLDVRKCSGRLGRPLQVVGAHPLHANRLAQAWARMTASSSAPALPPFDRP